MKYFEGKGQQCQLTLLVNPYSLSILLMFLSAFVDCFLFQAVMEALHHQYLMSCNFIKSFYPSQLAEINMYQDCVHIPEYYAINIVIYYTTVI